MQTMRAPKAVPGRESEYKRWSLVTRHSPSSADADPAQGNEQGFQHMILLSGRNQNCNCGPGHTLRPLHFPKADYGANGVTGGGFVCRSETLKGSKPAVP